jgi:hypothetical protein
MTIVSRCQRPDGTFAFSSWLGVVHDRVGQHLQRYVTIEVGVAGAIDLTHAARADERKDFVGAETVAGSESRGCARVFARITAPADVKFRQARRQSAI